MHQSEHHDFLILGSGQGGKLLAWHLARSGQRVAVVERRWIGGSCPAVACLPSKNEIWSARVAHLARHAAQFGTEAGPVTTDLAKVRRRKQDMIDRDIASHLNAYNTSGAELIMGSGRFIASKTIDVTLNDGGKRVLVGPVWRWSGRLPILRLWSSTSCRRISSCSAAAMSAWKWPRPIADSAAA